MPSPTHQALTMLFTHRPEFAVELVRHELGMALPTHTETVLTTNQLAAVELAADVVVLLKDEEHTVCALIVEVQLGINIDKLYSWPCYVSILRRREKCPCFLLVITPDEQVASWCRNAISVGSGSIEPIVLGPSQLGSLAGESVELSVLTAVAHARDLNVEHAVKTAQAALKAIASLDDERSSVYFDLVHSALSAAARKALEATMGNYEYQSEFARKYFSQGEAKGKADGEARGKAESLLLILSTRGFTLEPHESDRVRTCADLALLDRWIARALNASQVSEVLVDD